MTTDAAHTIRKGAYIMHYASNPPYRPLRVTQVEQTHTGRVMLRFASLRNAWLPATEYARPKASWRAFRGWWVEHYKDEKTGEWVHVQIPIDVVREQYRAEMP